MLSVSPAPRVFGLHGVVPAQRSGQRRRLCQGLDAGGDVLIGELVKAFGSGVQTGHGPTSDADLVGPAGAQPNVVEQDATRATSSGWAAAQRA